MGTLENNFENRVKKLICAGQGAWGAGLPDASEFIAKLTVDTGVDFVWMDLEHRAYDTHAVQWIPIICRRKQCEPIIRVAGLDSQLIKKALDIGASGVIIPQIDNAEQARRAVEYAKYPPEGSRGVSPMWTFFMDVSYDDYLPRANEETLVIVQIETADGIRNMESIAAVEGVDLLFAGPMDISAALGHIGNIQHPEVQKFLQEFPARATQAGKPSAITLRGYEASKWAYEAGYRFISIGSLTFQGSVGLTDELRRLRELAGR